MQTKILLTLMLLFFTITSGLAQGQSKDKYYFKVNKAQYADQFVDKESMPHVENLQLMITSGEFHIHYDEECEIYTIYNHLVTEEKNRNIIKLVGWGIEVQLIEFPGQEEYLFLIDKPSDKRYILNATFDKLVPNSN